MSNEKCLWKPNDLETDRYREMKEHMRKHGGRNWDDAEFVERYLAGYLCLINMNVLDTRKAVETMEKTAAKQIHTLNQMTKEIRRLNENMEKYLKVSMEIPFEMNLLKMRTERMLDKMEGGDGEMYAERIRQKQEKREEITP